MTHYVVTWNTASGNNAHDLLRDEILDELGINRNDIISGSIQPFISPPNHPFSVPRLARPGHELCISGGISFDTINGNSYKVEELYYLDRGHRHGPLSGVLHYNCEVRLTNENDDSQVYNRGDPIIQDHVISGARYIRVDMPPAGNATNGLSRTISP